MLETIRAYASERFAASRRQRTPSRERHYRYFLPRSLSATAPIGRCAGSDRKQHLARLDAEIDNLQAARSTGRSTEATPNARSLCVAALGLYWMMRDRYADAVDWIDRTLRLPGADATGGTRPGALHQDPRSCSCWDARPNSPRSSPRLEAHRHDADGSA